MERSANHFMKINYPQIETGSRNGAEYFLHAYFKLGMGRTHALNNVPLCICLIVYLNGPEISTYEIFKPLGLERRNIDKDLARLTKNNWLIKSKLNDLTVYSVTHKTQALFDSAFDTSGS